MDGESQKGDFPPLSSRKACNFCSTPWHACKDLGCCNACQQIYPETHQPILPPDHVHVPAYRIARRLEGYILEVYCEDEDACGRIARAPNSVVIPYGRPIQDSTFNVITDRDVQVSKGWILK